MKWCCYGESQLDERVIFPALGAKTANNLCGEKGRDVAA